MTHVRYFAAAADAAGIEAEERHEASLTALRAALVADHPDLLGILPQCAMMLDGVRTDGDGSLEGVALIDVLPPFAGG